MKIRDIRKLEREELVVKNARISGTDLGYVHTQHGILSFRIHLDYADGNGKSFGGYTLDGPNKNYPDLDNRDPSEFASAVIIKILQVFGKDWEKLTGTPVRVLKENTWGGDIKAIGHYLKDDWVYVNDLIREFIHKPETIEYLKEQYHIIDKKIQKLMDEECKELLRDLEGIQK